MASVSDTNSEKTQQKAKSSEETSQDEFVSHDEAFLKELENAAKHRYTEKDEEFAKIKIRVCTLPPLIPDYPPRRDYRGGFQHDRNYNRGGYADSKPYDRDNKRSFNSYDNRDSDRSYARRYY